MQRTATLLFDSATAELMPGVRAVAGGERSLLFRADDLAIDLVVFESAGLATVHGQVVSTASGSGVADARVRLDEAEPTRTDAFGQFALSTVDPVDGAVLHAEIGPTVLACPVPATTSEGIMP